MSIVRSRLRAATADAHAALDRALDLEARLQGTADLACVLARFHGFFRPLEAALHAHLGPAVMSGRDRCRELAADLATLGLGAAAIAALPECATAGDLACASEAWGALYVTEGARLGGRIIARDLACRGIVRDLRFWSEHPGSAPPWTAFVRALEEVPEPARAEAGAVATFARLQDWMTACAAPGGSVETPDFRRPDGRRLRA